MAATFSTTVERRGIPDRTAENIQLIGFRLAAEEYAIEITKVREIIRPVPVTRLPRAPDYVLGLINLRSEVIPVVDLRRRLGLPSREPSDDARVVVADVGGKTWGMTVDAVSEVLRIAEDRIVPPPPSVAGPGREYLTGLVQLDDRLLILLDIEILLEDRENAASEHVGYVSA